MSKCANMQIVLPARLYIDMCLFIDICVQFYMYEERHINKTWVIFCYGNINILFFFFFFLACKYGTC